ncbi:hypothetical protein [Hymenobacter saemangeumensis]
MTEERRAEITACRAASTPGRWYWDIRPRSNSVSLLSANHSTVLDATRWGFGGATIRMIDAQNHWLVSGIHEDAEPHPGRKHHAGWTLTSRRPDAVFIANAGVFVDELLEEVARLQAENNRLENEAQQYVRGAQKLAQRFTDKPAFSEYYDAAGNCHRCGRFFTVCNGCHE